LRVMGVVPAAGLSTRMGNPKPLMDAGGRSFLARVLAALRGGGTHDVVVGVRHEKGPIAAEARNAGARVVVPTDVEDGPIATVRAAIRLLDGPEVAGLLLHPVDHPLVKAETVGTLLDAASDRSSPTGARSGVEDVPVPSIVVPVEGGRSGHPVFFSRTLFPELLEPDLPEGARTVLNRHRDRVVEVAVDDRGVLADLNTLADYRRHFPDSYRKRFQKW